MYKNLGMKSTACEWPTCSLLFLLLFCTLQQRKILFLWLITLRNSLLARCSKASFHLWIAFSIQLYFQWLLLSMVTRFFNFWLWFSLSTFQGSLFVPVVLSLFLWIELSMCLPLENYLNHSMTCVGMINTWHARSRARLWSLLHFLHWAHFMMKILRVSALSSRSR